MELSTEQRASIGSAAQKAARQRGIKAAERREMEAEAIASAQRNGFRRTYICRDGVLVPHDEHALAIRKQRMQGRDATEIPEMNRLHRIYHCDINGDTSAPPAEWVTEHRADEWAFEGAAYTAENVQSVDTLDANGDIVEAERYPNIEWHVERIQDFTASLTEPEA